MKRSKSIQEMLEALEMLGGELSDAMDAVQSLINELEQTKTRDEAVDIVNGNDWGDLLENAEYIGGSIECIKEARLKIEECCYKDGEPDEMV